MSNVRKQGGFFFSRQELRETQIPSLALFRLLGFAHGRIIVVVQSGTCLCCLLPNSPTVKSYVAERELQNKLGINYGKATTRRGWGKRWTGGTGRLLRSEKRTPIAMPSKGRQARRGRGFGSSAQERDRERVPGAGRRGQQPAPSP